MTGATTELAEFVASTRYADLPIASVESARIAVLDDVANLLAGSAQPVARIIAGHVRDMGGAPACSVVSAALRTSPTQAAFANGVALH